LIISLEKVQKIQLFLHVTSGVVEGERGGRRYLKYYQEKGETVIQ